MCALIICALCKCEINVSREYLVRKINFEKCPAGLIWLTRPSAGKIRLRGDGETMGALKNNFQSMKSNVGVSLLAIAVCQSTQKSTEPPLSRAGSLLQGLVGLK
ncbi:hypothetical protein EMIT0P265_130099 [Pseudomonas zeae]